jgi:DMSO/TMAO reductase YedYZ heme-binding membrane subunit
MSEQIWWFTSRASGMVLWLLLAATLAWGLAVSGQMVRRAGLPAWMLDLHKHLGTLSMVFTAIHLVALWADSYVTFGWQELFIPMASGWKPGAVAWGIAAFYLLVIVQGTSVAMKRFPRAVWRRLHMLSLPLFVTGSVHGVLSGTDWPKPAVRWTFIVVCAAVIWVATYRVLKAAAGRGTPDERTERLAAVRAARDSAMELSPTVGAQVRTAQPSAGWPPPVGWAAPLDAARISE